MLNSTRVKSLKLIELQGIKRVGRNLVLQGRKYIIKMETQGITQNLIVYVYLFPLIKEVKEIILKKEKVDMPKKRKLNSRNPRYLIKKEETKIVLKKIPFIGKAKGHGVFYKNEN